ncbi:MAG TPA: hypothetical protein VJU87_09005 [Gemmatimonadaceae bacterium]|nr:hypothetical protein [Gemmatimonadaceae bacterium]
MKELHEILARSLAAEPFKSDVLAFCSRGSASRIHVHGALPQVKIQRLLTHMLFTEPELPVERIALRGSSGCADFTGQVEVRTRSETRVYEFVWDCRWRAEQEGWRDWFGLPDQIRAAQEFDWRCFQVWRQL